MGNKTMQTANALLLIAALIYAFVGRDLALWRAESPGPGFLPLLLSLCLIVLAIILFVQETRKPSPSPALYLRMPMLITAALVVYIFLLPILGYPIANALLLLACVRLYEPHGWRMDISMCVGISVAFYVVFVWLLHLELPHGFLRG